MTLTVSRSQDGQYVLSGTERGSIASVPLGQRYFKVGAHWIGFDDRFVEPLIVRAYYDPDDPEARRLAKLAAFTGYLQVMRISAGNTTIAPSIYGGRLADRQVYLYRENRFLDFMGPASALIHGVTRPLYPYNAMLIDGRLSEDAHFCAAGLANGSLYSPADYTAQLDEQLGLPQSAVASLVTEVAPGLVTSADVAKALQGAIELTPLTPSARDLAGKEAYRYALDWLKTTPLPGSTAPPLQDLDESQVIAELIGDYVLLTLPDTFDGATLVIQAEARPGGTIVHVWSLSDYDMEDLVADKAGQLLWRVREAQLDAAAVLPVPATDGGSPGWGHRGLWTPPDGTTPGLPGLIELRYWTVPVAYRKVNDGKRGTSLVPYQLDPITWAVLFEYSSITEQLTLSSIGVPEPASMKISGALKVFQSALSAKSASTALIDTSNFTKAAMRRDTFARGTLRFVDKRGAEVPAPQEAS